MMMARSANTQTLSPRGPGRISSQRAAQDLVAEAQSPTQHIFPLDDGNRKWALGVVDGLMRQRGCDIFCVPVDLLLYPHYFDAVGGKPMDLGTVRARLVDVNEGYQFLDEFFHDVRQVWLNAKTFNPPSHPVYKTATSLSNNFERKVASLHRRQSRKPRAREESPPPRKRRRSSTTPRSKKRKQATGGSALNTMLETLQKQVAGLQKQLDKRIASNRSPAGPKPLAKTARRRLKRDIQLLPTEAIEGVVNIIISATKDNTQEGDEFEIDLDLLEDDTIRQLQTYVRRELAAARKRAKTSSKASPPRVVPPTPTVSASPFRVAGPAGPTLNSVDESPDGIFQGSPLFSSTPSPGQSALWQDIANSMEATSFLPQVAQSDDDESSSDEE